MSPFRSLKGLSRNPPILFLKWNISCSQHHCCTTQAQGVQALGLLWADAAGAVASVSCPRAWKMKRPPVPCWSPDLKERQRALEHIVSMSPKVSGGNYALPNLSYFLLCFFQSLESTRRMLQLVEEVRISILFVLLLWGKVMESLTHWGYFLPYSHC